MEIGGQASIFIRPFLSMVAWYQATSIRLYDLTNVEFWPVRVCQEISDASPLNMTVIGASFSLIEKLAMRSAHILLVFLAILNSHYIHLSITLDDPNPENERSR